VALLRDEIGRFLRQRCHGLIQLVIEMRQDHLGLINFVHWLRLRCRDLIAFRETVL
jgi:hypothetical protein